MPIYARSLCSSSLTYLFENYDLVFFHGEDDVIGANPGLVQSFFKLGVRIDFNIIDSNNLPSNKPDTQNYKNECFKKVILHSILSSLHLFLSNFMMITLPSLYCVQSNCP